MSQAVFSNIDPDVTTGLMLAALLDDFKDAMMSGLSGVARPPQLLAGGIWIDTSLQDAPTYKWSMKIYTGTVDREILSVDVLTGASGVNKADDSFTVRRVSDDTAGAILNLMKARVAGQVQEDDLIARINLVGHTNSNVDTIAAYISATAVEDQTSSESGVLLSFYSTAAGTNSVIEHLRMIGGGIESIVRHKFNAVIYGQDTVAGSTNMVVTDDKLVTEITGGSGENIHGVENDSNGTKFKVIVNAGTSELVLKHQSNTAAEGQRFKFPNADDITVPANGSVTLYYCSAESRWKYITGAIKGLKSDLFTVHGGYTEWVSPITGKIRVVAYPRHQTRSGSAHANAFGMNSDGRIFSWGDNSHGQLGLGDVTNRSSPVVQVGILSFIDAFIGENSAVARQKDDTTYTWGLNNHGQLGVNDVVKRSSPTLVVGGYRFTRTEIKETTYGMAPNGLLYAWGRNDAGQIGDGTIVSKSSPVAVLLGIKFSEFYTGKEGENRIFAVARDSGQLYAWGQNANGCLGVGDTTSRSSPVAVLGSLKLSQVAVGSNSTVALSSDGTLYSWGLNDVGQLGLGDTTPRSSPIAVLGGLKFQSVRCIGDKSYLAYQADGTAYAWGDNANGQLGVGDTTVRSSPVAVVGGLFFQEIIAPQNGSVIAITTTGGVYAWGLNTNGQLALNDTIPRSSPVSIVGGLTLVEIRAQSAGGVYAFATDGKTYAWGLNTSGQLGDGTTVAKSSPVAVLNSISTSGLHPLEAKYSYLSVVKGTTYAIRCGGGVAMFGDIPVGTNIARLTVAYEN